VNPITSWPRATNSLATSRESYPPDSGTATGRSPATRAARSNARSIPDSSRSRGDRGPVDDTVDVGGSDTVDVGGSDPSGQ